MGLRLPNTDQAVHSGDLRAALWNEIIRRLIVQILETERWVGKRFNNTQGLFLNQTNMFLYKFGQDSSPSIHIYYIFSLGEGLLMYVCYKDTPQRVLLKIGTTHSTSQKSMDCQTHVWSGPMEEHVT